MKAAVPAFLGLDHVVIFVRKTMLDSTALELFHDLENLVNRTHNHPTASDILHLRKLEPREPSQLSLNGRPSLEPLNDEGALIDMGHFLP